MVLDFVVVVALVRRIIGLGGGEIAYNCFHRQQRPLLPITFPQLPSVLKQGVKTCDPTIAFRWGRGVLSEILASEVLALISFRADLGNISRYLDIRPYCQS